MWPLLARAALGLLLLAALVVVWRRLAGALTSASNPVILVLTGIWIAGAAVAARHARRFPTTPTRKDLLFSGALSLAVLALAAALSLPGQGAGALGLFWLVLLGEETWGWMGWFRRVRPARGVQRKDQRSAPCEPQLAPTAESTVLQQLELRQSPDGKQELSGWVRMPVVAGQRTGNIHIAFCPPFGSIPQVEIEQVEGPPARIKPARVLAYGARFEVKLAATSDSPGSVKMRFSAVARQQSQHGDERPCRDAN
jgi:hypothetical protein